ncbi:hypothetical protein [Halorubrum saccharovorum]|uniref:hypothetical protein n=1 Tax=Halorubrum saccharovorum TaxID=2248 RepID=UPI000679C816|nr:hypothetical protein [Halorubrum saccharovorum]
MWACARLTGNAQNGVVDPERAALLDAGFTPAEIDASETDPWGGQLADAIAARLVYQNPLSGTQLGAPLLDGSLRAVLGALANGVPLDGTGDDEAGLARECFAPMDSLTAGAALALYWELPFGEVGNEVQTDSVAFDLDFRAEQCRHNDGEVNPCIEASADDGYGVDRLARPPVWFARARNGAGQVNDQLLVGNAPANTGDYDTAGVAWTDPTTAELTVTHDATTGSLSIAIDDGDGSSAAVSYAGTLADVTSVGATSNAIVLTAKGDSGVTASVTDVRLNGSVPSGGDAVSSVDGSTDIAHLLIDGVNASVDWTLTASVTLVGAGGGGSQERPAVDVNVA